MILSFFLKLFGAKRLVKSVKVLPTSIKSINRIQKYPHIIESYACILKIFAATMNLSLNFFFFLEYVQLQKYQSK